MPYVGQFIQPLLLPIWRIYQRSMGNGIVVRIVPLDSPILILLPLVQFVNPVVLSIFRISNPRLIRMETLLSVLFDWSIGKIFAKLDLCRLNIRDLAAEADTSKTSGGVR